RRGAEVTAEVRLDDFAIRRKYQQAGRVVLELPVTARARQQGTATLAIDVTPALIPSEMFDSGDTRHLGVRLYPFEWIRTSP
ncbi:MAG: hypothetical protein ACYS22_12075, partial [Planctomycetota bacterium]